MVSSSGWTASSSSHGNGVETVGVGRAPKTVLWGAFWLKSMKTRAPRSSFHHAAVSEVGSAPLQLAGHGHGRGPHLVGVPLRLAAARRRGGPRLPVVLGKRREPELVEQRLHLGGRPLGPSSKVTPGLGSRSMRSSSACSGSSAVVRPRRGSRGSPGSPPTATWARSATTRALDVVPLGVVTIVVCSQSGAPCRHPLLEERLAGRARWEALHQRRAPPAHRRSSGSSTAR